MPGRIARCSTLVLLATCCALGDGTYAAPPTSAERGQVKQAEAALSKAGNLYRAKKYRESGAAAKEALEILQSLPADNSAPWETLLAPPRKQLSRAKELLAGQGVEIPEWSAALDATDPGDISFTKQVASVLLARCGNCHVQRARGEFSMASFAALSKGSPGGVVLMPGDATGSRLIEVIESGEMPRGGGTVDAKELDLLRRWIDGGAKFDGPDEAASLASLDPGATPEMARLEVVAAGANDEVQFARDIGPILQDNCLGCHGDTNAGANFGMNTFARMLQGGGNGPPLVPGMPAESLLIKKLRGTATGGERMPQGRDPLPEEVIAKIEKWIALGGKFDGLDAAMNLADVVAQSAAVRMSHAELTAERVALAEKTWRLILPDIDANREENEHVLVVGTPGKEVLAAVATTAAQQSDRLRKLFKVADEQPLVRGRTTLYVFDKRFDYSEVGTMLERRQLPAAWRGHWTFNPLQPYGCILLSETGEATPGLVTQQLAGVYIASLGKVPRWFAEGSARAIAVRFDPKDSRVKQWDEQAAAVLDSTESPEGFLAGTLPPEDSDVLSYSFVSKLLMTPPTRYVNLIVSLQNGTSFDQAFAKAYGGTPDEVVPNWLTRAARRRR